MRIHHKKNRTPLVIAIILSLLVIGYLAAAVYFHLWPFSAKQEAVTLTLTEQKQAETKTAADQKAAYLNATKDGSIPPSAPAPVPTESSSITLDAVQQSSSVVITSKLSGAGYSSGTCSLTVTGNDKTVKQTAEVIYQPEYSTCAGFSVPTSDLGAGTWNISLSVTPLNGQPIIKTTSLEVR